MHIRKLNNFKKNIDQLNYEIKTVDSEGI
jgi:hypothetical protein